MSIICVHCIYMCLHIIVHVYLYNYDKMFIDKLQIVLKSLLTCKIHKSALEYSIIRRYTNVVYYYSCNIALRAVLLAAMSFVCNLFN